MTLLWFEVIVQRGATIVYTHIIYCTIFTFLTNCDYMKFLPSIKMFLVAQTKGGLILRDRLIGLCHAQIKY